jgi:GNAT superfamily N-acetyltransferase
MKTDSVHLFVNAWKQLSRRLPSPRFEETDGVACCFGDVPNLFLNLWVQVQPTATADQLKELLAAAKNKAIASEHPVGGVLREDWLPSGWEDLASRHGYSPLVPMTGMETDELAPPRRPLAKLDVVRVADGAGARDLAALNAAAYKMPMDAFECIAAGTWPADCHAYVGYVGDKPVSSSAALPVDDTVYIALVATAPDEERKGYAEAVMRHAVFEGRKAMGVKRTTLHATEMGRPLYSAMGYASGPRFLLVAPNE